MSDSNSSNSSNSSYPSILGACTKRKVDDYEPKITDAPKYWAPVKQKGSKSKFSKTGLKIRLNAPRKLDSELLAVVDFNNPTWAPVKTVVWGPLSNEVQGTNLNLLKEFEE